MYVCSCKAVTDRTVRAAITSGASTLDQVGTMCGAGTVCGGCHVLIEELLADAVVIRAARSGHSAA
jgi:bacterioferritin-associated ferredoxin